MIIFSAALLLTATPIHVVAVHGGGNEAGLALKALAATNATTTDASSLHTYLLRPAGMLRMQDFGGFTAGPPPSWPRAASAVWTNAVAHCRTLVGPPPWKASSMPMVMSCANRLSEFLWQRYAAEVKAARVFVVEVSVEEHRNESQVTGVVWEPSAADQLTVDERGAAADVKALIGRVTKALLAKQGLSTPRSVVSEFGSGAAGTPDPFPREAKVTTAIKLMKSCAALPVKLEVTPSGALGESFAARWAPADATGPQLTCSLSFTEHPEDGPIGPMTIVTVTSTCGKTSFAVEGAKDRGRDPVDVLSNKLAQALAAKLCP
jgi:hypothetical protein